MSAGQRDQRVAIDEEVRVSDGGGGYTKTWNQVTEVWAAVWAIGAKEQVSAERQEGSVLYRVRMQRSATTAAVGVTHRFRWVTNGGLALNVKGVLDRGPRESEIEFIAESGTPT